jgi:pimeloyl-ACP methyl ester carboxylesterase
MHICRMAAYLLLGFTSVQASAADVRIQTAGGTQIHGQHLGQGEQGVVLVHGDKGDATDWANLSKRLSTHGYSVLSIDLRGHGKSTSPAEPTEQDYPLMVQDVDAGVKWILGKGATTVTVIGAELGANLALNSAAQSDSVASLVLISPSLNANGVKTATQFEGYGDRPAMLVAAADETIQAKTAQLLKGKAKGAVHLELIPGTGSGIRLLNTSPELESLVFSWLNGTLLASQRDSRNVTVGEVSDIKTTGTKLEDRK